MTEVNNNLPVQDKSHTFYKKIGSTVYEVSVHFSQTSRESMDDKILRLIQNDAINQKIS